MNEIHSAQQPPALTTDDLKKRIISHIKQSLGIKPNIASNADLWEALSLTIRDITLELSQTSQDQQPKAKRIVYYFSVEYLVGRLLKNNLINLKLYNQAQEVIESLGANLSDVLETENDPALGNGGLGRLAACFLDSLSTLKIPAYGYGIFYRFGIFKQAFVDGKQVEIPDDWQQSSNPCSIKRPRLAQQIKLYGNLSEKNGKTTWENTVTIQGMPWDIFITGYESTTVNTLRLWEGKAPAGFNMTQFDAGRYQDSRAREIEAETISQVLYPNDDHYKGKELRLVQQYFFVACSLADIISRHKTKKNTWADFTKEVVIQLNDTHPSIAIVELIRILMDEENLPFIKSLELSRMIFCYTNHTLLPEALEAWPLGLFTRVLPRHLQIILKINDYFLHQEVEKLWPKNNGMKRRLSIIQEPEGSQNQQMVRMAFLSVIGSHKVNGVAKLHSHLLQNELFPGFHKLWPNKFTNITNGVTPRRWLTLCNPRLADLIDKTIGQQWRVDLNQLQSIKKYADDPVFQQKFEVIKFANKCDLCSLIQEETGITVNPEAIFDVHIKRLHEYKRQQLKLLHIITLYKKILDNPELDIPQQVFIFGAKAAPGYHIAKNIIHAINHIADVVNNNPVINNRLKIVFMPNYRVSIAEKIIPAANLSEQISTAGFEASGTGNMKLALNGALTIGTMDGANVEIADEIGKENMFIFGLTVEEIRSLRQTGYDPKSIYHKDRSLKDAIDWLHSIDLCPNQQKVFMPLVSTLLEQGDYFLTLADFASYSQAYNKMLLTWQNPKLWWRMAIINTASMGKFSSDRSIQEYDKHIWNLSSKKPTTNTVLVNDIPSTSGNSLAEFSN